MSFITPLSYLKSCLVSSKCLRSVREKPAAEVEILLLLSQIQMGAPAQDGFQPPKGALCLSPSLARVAGDVFPS